MPTVTGRATDFITFSRPGATGGGATVTDSDGKIKWAGHNLLTNSESFDASAWTKSTTAAATVTSNTSAAPNSTTTADRVVGAAGLWFVKQNISQAIGQKFTFGVWVKSNTGSSQTFRIYGDETTTISANLTATTSWQLFTLEFTASQAGNYAVGVIADSSQTAADLLVWGAHLYRSDLGGMVLNPARGDAYYPTTPRNLLGSTEDFSAAAWVKNLIATFGSGSIANAIVAPNGLQTADKIAASASAGYHALRQSVAVTTAPYVFSFYAKAAEYSLCYVTDIVNAQFRVAFNLASGAVVAGTTGGANYVSSAITSVGDGWYRCSISLSGMASTPTFALIGYPSSGATLDGYGVQYTGDGTSGIYLWGAQLSDSASLDAYSPVYGAAVTSAAYYAPRLDYDPVTLAPLGLLVEEQRTNVLLYTAAFDVSATWVPTEVNVSTDAAVAPDGTTTADKFIPSTNPLQHRLQQNVTSIASVVTGSVYVKLDGSGVNKVALFNGGTACIAYFNLSTLTATGEANVTSPTITPVGSGWFRLQATWPASQPTIRLSIFASSGSDGLSPVAGNGTDGIFLWGAQLEAGSFATSYIPNGSAVAGATRTADVASVSTQAFPYSATEGTVVLNISNGTARTGGSFALCTFDDGNGGYDNSRQLYFQNDTGDVRAYESSNNVVAVDQIAYNGPPNTSVTGKQAYTYKANDFASAFNGAAVVQLSTSGNPALNIRTMGLGSDFNASASGAVTGRVYIRQITYIPRRLSNSELQARTV
jgi:hypothetical protein